MPEEAEADKSFVPLEEISTNNMVSSNNNVADSSSEEEIATVDTNVQTASLTPEKETHLDALDDAEKKRKMMIGLPVKRKKSLHSIADNRQKRIKHENLI